MTDAGRYRSPFRHNTYTANLTHKQRAENYADSDSGSELIMDKNLVWKLLCVNIEKITNAAFLLINKTKKKERPASRH